MILHGGKLHHKFTKVINHKSMAKLRQENVINVL